MPLATLHSLLDFIAQKIADDGLTDISLMGCFPPADQDLDSTVMWALIEKVAKAKLRKLSIGDFGNASHLSKALISRLIVEAINNAPITFARFRGTGFDGTMALKVLQAFNRGGNLTTLTDVRLASNPSFFNDRQRLGILCQFLKKQTSLRYVDFRYCEIGS